MGGFRDRVGVYIRNVSSGSLDQERSDEVVVKAQLYADKEVRYFPKHFDDQTKQLVRFMISEAYATGHNSGYEIGFRTGQDVSVGLLNDVIGKLQDDGHR